MVWEDGTRNLLERVLHDASAEPTDLPLSFLRAITNNFSDDLQIGSGGFAVVYKGQLGNNGTVAVKKLSQTLEVHEKKFNQEIDSLMRVKHKNVVRFLGYCSDTQGKVWKYDGKNVMAEERQRLLCFEFLPKGSLDKYISDASQGLEWRTRYQIIRGVCEGLHYLHQQKIVHLDLKPANILLDYCMVPKIADFGLSKCFGEKQTRAITTKLFGSLGYMAPEFYSRVITFKSDIYSLGVIIIEILTGEKGYPEIQTVLERWSARFEASLADIRLQYIRVCAEIGIECIDTNPAKRPVTQSIIEMLDETERAYGFTETEGCTPLASQQEKMGSTDMEKCTAKVLGETNSEGNNASPQQLLGRRKRVSKRLRDNTAEKQETTVVDRGSRGQRLWVMERIGEWWDRMSSPDCPEEDFQRAFRMSRATFDAVCEDLYASLAKDDTMRRSAIPVRQRVAVCLWRLATAEPLRLMSKRFGLGISTCHNLVLEVCAAIKAVLMPKAVAWPEGPEAFMDISAKFEAASGIPNVVGAMYTTHIHIIEPKINAAAYFNRRITERTQKTSYSITVQGVVDAAGVFTDICIGWPGSMTETDVLERSALCARAQHAAAGQWVVGGAGYPLMDWLLVPYTNDRMSRAQHVFNERLACLRAVARAAFQRLKARWSCLRNRNEVRLQDLPVMLGACFVLHNICESDGGALCPKIDFQLFDDDMVAENPVLSEAAAGVRDAIAENLLHFPCN